MFSLEVYNKINCSDYGDENWNDIPDGVYRVGSRGINSPFGYDGYVYIVFCIRRVFQFAIRISNSIDGRIVQRYYSNGEWNEWYRYNIELTKI